MEQDLGRSLTDSFVFAIVLAIVVGMHLGALLSSKIFSTQNQPRV